MKKDSKPTQFSKDTPIILLLILDGALMLAGMLSVFFRLRPNDFRIPVQYVVYDGTVLQSGNWYSLYALIIFLLVGGGITIYIAHKLYKANRYFTIAALASYAVVGLFALLSINALLSLVQRV